MVYHEGSEEELKIELAAVIRDSSRLSQLLDYILAEVVDVRQKLGASHGVIRFIGDDSYASLGLSLWSLAKNFRAGLRKPVNEAFRAGFIAVQFDADAVIDRITVCFSNSAALDNGDGLTKHENIVDWPADPKVVEL